jgi:hypothetical protein
MLCIVIFQITKRFDRRRVNCVPKKNYKAGDILVMRTRKEEDPLILEWANVQGEIGDAIRYLIEEEIKRNGLRNLVENIKRKRPALSVPEQVIDQAPAQDRQSKKNGIPVVLPSRRK